MRHVVAGQPCKLERLVFTAGAPLIQYESIWSYITGARARHGLPFGSFQLMFLGSFQKGQDMPLRLAASEETNRLIRIA